MHLLTGKVDLVVGEVTDYQGYPVISIHFVTTHKAGVRVTSSEDIWFHFPRDAKIKEGDMVVISGSIAKVVCPDCGTDDLLWVAGKWNCNLCGRNVDDPE